MRSRFCGQSTGSRCKTTRARCPAPAVACAANLVWPLHPSTSPRVRHWRVGLRLAGLVGGAVVDIVAAHDVVLAQVAADLHFDDLERRLAWVFKAVPLGG